MSGIFKLILGNLHYLIILNAVHGAWNDYQASEAEAQKYSSQAPGINLQIEKAKKKIEVARRFKEDLEVTKKRVEVIRNKIKEVQKKLPNKTDDTEILDMFKNLATSININEIFLTPGTENTVEFYVEKEYIFRGKGTWLQFLIFFESLLKRDRIFNVSSMTLKRTQTKQKGRFQLINLDAKLRAYRYNSSYKGEEKSDKK